MAISWSTAFEKAIVYVLYSIVWDIIGLILIILSLYIVGYHFSIGFSGINYNGSIIFPAVLFIVGLIFIFFGNMASFFKVFGDTIADEVEARLAQDEGSDQDEESEK